MIFLVLILFLITLNLAEKKRKIITPISNARRNWCYVLGMVGISQLIIGATTEIKHCYIGIFCGAWAWFAYNARKEQKKTWKTTIKTIILVLSSINFLGSIDRPHDLAPTLYQSVYLLLIITLRINYSSIKHRSQEILMRFNVGLCHVIRDAIAFYKSHKVIIGIISVAILLIILPYVLKMFSYYWDYVCDTAGL